MQHRWGRNNLVFALVKVVLSYFSSQGQREADQGRLSKLQASLHQLQQTGGRSSGVHDQLLHLPHWGQGERQEIVASSGRHN